ncbi:hypothetical protein PIB30_055910 [Stylosanthes scabra]|uniref:Zinc knuckle CX2CX4HX4C domain-containing protein n=1 Tax=Stylosanthes scabra TaxID=79078 RepID=A0ABU6SJ67_9FABA|nr:hypothetical protein [Stylosanthes scabra]
MRPQDVKIMKVKCKVDVSAVLRQSVRVASPDRKCYDILLKYEKLGVYCRCCGFLGHETRKCDLYLTLSSTAAHVDPKWRADFKADQVGWRATESKENANPNWRGKSSSNHHANRKPTPPSFQIGTTNTVVSKKNKRQKLKHLARGGGSGEATQNVTGFKRTTIGAGLDTDIGNELALEVNAADRGMGANPIRAPTTQ